MLRVDGRYAITCTDCAPVRPVASTVPYRAPDQHVWLTRDEILNRGTGWTTRTAYRWLGDPRRNRPSDGAGQWTLAQVEAAEEAVLNR